MATVSFRVPDEMKQQLEEHEEINWSAVLRQHLADELEALETKNIAHAVATSERLSQTIDKDAVSGQNTAQVIREFRDARYGRREIE